MAHYCKSLWTIVISLTLVSSQTLGTCPGLDFKISLCVKGARSEVQTLELLYRCAMQSLHRCLEFHQPQHHSHVESQLICGVKNSGFDIE